MSYIYYAFFLLGILSFMGLAVLLTYRQRKLLGTVSPVGEKMLRPAGYSLRVRIEDAEASSFFSALFGFIVPVLLALLPFVVFPDQFLQNVSILVAVGALSLVVLFAGWIAGFHLAYDRLNQISNSALGLRGEELVAQQLNPLYRKGYRIYHDFPIEGRNRAANIDHIVIGPNGIFVIETKMRRKHKKLKSARQSHKVEFNGDELIYPNFRDRHGLDQTAANAAHLSEFLWKKTGKRLPVTGILILPGWYVEQTKPGRVQVVSHKTVVRRILSGKRRIDQANFRDAVVAVREVCCDVVV